MHLDGLLMMNHCLHDLLAFLARSSILAQRLRCYLVWNVFLWERSNGAKMGMG
jgi:hypothetical protein